MSDSAATSRDRFAAATEQAAVAVEDELLDLQAKLAERRNSLRHARSPDEFAALEAEISALQADEGRCHRTLKDIWRVYRQHTAWADAAVAPTLPGRVSRGQPNSKSSRVRDRIVAILRELGPTHRSRILEVLVADGLLGTEARPINRLATILAENRHLFGSDGRGTYFLAAAGQTEQRRTIEHSGLSGLRRPTLPALQPEQGGEGHAGA